MSSITIKQSSEYINYSLPHWVEPYDYTVVYCECGKLMERDMGICDYCIDNDLLKMEEYNRSHT